MLIDHDLELRSLELQHAEELFALVDKNRAHLRRWLPWLDVNTAPEHSRAFIQSTLEKSAKSNADLRHLVRGAACRCDWFTRDQMAQSQDLARLLV